jgi:hypothetical protein
METLRQTRTIDLRIRGRQTRNRSVRIIMKMIITTIITMPKSFFSGMK